MPTEFDFELQVCQWAERHWPPEGDTDTAVVVARQLGTAGRRWDTVVLECDPVGLAERARFGTRRLDSDLLHVLQHAPAEWAWYRDALPHPGYPWRYVREAVHRAADRNVLEKRTENGRIQIRRRFAYPDWVRRVVAIENKPDMDASAARQLASQVERDVALSLADEVWVATAATGERVEPALLADVPVEAGLLLVESGARGADQATVRWQPATLAVDDPGTDIRERPSGGEYDASACRFEYRSPDWKRGKRLAIAERAYERGWRSYLASMRPDCRAFELRPTAAVARPHCTAKGRRQTPRECSSSCPHVEPEPPAWRQRDWPIAGGPGAATKRLLDRQRARERPDPPADSDS